MDPKKLMGFETEADKKVALRSGDFYAMKLALWRSKVSWEIAVREAKSILDQCSHNEGCPAKTDEAGVCLSDVYENQQLVSVGCPDREKRLSSLVILNAARRFAPLDAKKLADAPYFAPSREHFSAVLGELAATQAELAELRGVTTKEPT